MKKGWWKIKPKGKGLVSIAFSGMDELFHPESKNASLIREAQKNRKMQLNSEGDPKHITIKLPKDN